MPIDLTAPGTSVGVVGAGAMGRGIAQVAAAAGYSVSLSDANAQAAMEGRDFAARMLRRAAEKGRMTAEAAAAAVDRLRVVKAIADLADCAIVIEAVVEDLAAKRKLFGELEAVVGPDCVIASNTSSLSITAIAAACARPQRVAGAHFFNPVPLMPLVEVVDGARGDPAVGDALMAFVARLGHRAVRVKDVPLFLVNHAGRAYSTEALAILDDGVAQPVDVDRVMGEAAGFPMGPFELFDLTALDVSHPSAESSFAQFYGEPRLRPSPETAKRLEAGLLGRKVGEGFYSYRDGKIVRPTEPPAPATLPARVWISGAEPDGQAAVAARLRPKAGRVDVETDASPSEAALCLVTPFGLDATTTAVTQGLDPVRTIAVDTLLPLDKRVTLMSTPLTAASRRDEAHGLFAATGSAVTTIADSPGFIAQRILAMVVNIACAIAQARIGVPDDIDEAVRIGRGYPDGPLSMGDSLGPARVLAILEALQRLTGDPRYRPSPWLRRRVQLGVSLKTADLAS